MVSHLALGLMCARNNSCGLIPPPIHPPLLLTALLHIKCCLTYRHIGPRGLIRRQSFSLAGRRLPFCCFYLVHTSEKGPRESGGGGGETMLSA